LRFRSHAATSREAHPNASARTVAEACAACGAEEKATYANVRIDLVNLDMLTPTRGFDKYAPGERNKMRWIRHYKNEDLEVKVNLILKTATTRPRLLQEAMLRMRDSLCKGTRVANRSSRKCGPAETRCLRPFGEAATRGMELKSVEPEWLCFDVCFISFRLVWTCLNLLGLFVDFL